jgi:RNA polymerase sigma factor (sigma-70 family)
MTAPKPDPVDLKPSDTNAASTRQGADQDVPSETQMDVLQAQRSLSSPSWHRLSGKITFQLRSFSGGVRLPPTLDFDDFVSEVILAVLRDISTFQDRGKGAFWAWVQRLAHNRLNDLWRYYDAQCRCGARRTIAANDDVDPLAEVADPHATTGTEILALRELEQAEWDCLRHLPSDMQRVYLLRRRDELPFRKIMTEIGRDNEVTVRSLYKRARDYVRRCLESKMDALGIDGS